MKTFQDNNLPCEDCITYPICRVTMDKIKKSYDAKYMGGAMIGLVDLMDKCSIFREFVMKMNVEAENK